MRHAVFARHTHPEGYGFPASEQTRRWAQENNRHEWMATAHGYVVVVVSCINKTEEVEVVDFVQRYGITGIFGNEWWDQWYGSEKGRQVNGHPRYGFDYLFTFEGDPKLLSHGWNWGSRGDNRYVGYVGAQEILSGNKEPT